MVTDNLVAVLAAMLLIVASGNAEWNEATSEPASKQCDDATEDPCESSLGLIDCGDAVFAAELACDLLGTVLKVSHRCGMLNNYLLLHRLLLHGLLLLLYERLLLHWHLRGGVGIHSSTSIQVFLYNSN